MTMPGKMQSKKVGWPTLGGDAEAGPADSAEDMEDLKKSTLEDQEIASKDWNDCLAKLYTRMDEKFEKKGRVLRILLAEHDTTK